MEGLNFHKQEQKEKGPDPLLLELWEKYDFPGQPPFKDSRAESRLKEACKKYSQIVHNLSSSYIHRGDAENYIPRTKSLERETSSDAERREAHNQIALMVAGEQRSGMAKGLAEQIADFALEYSDNL